MAHPLGAPVHVALIGSGRWAKEIAGVLPDVLPAGSLVTLHAPSIPDSWPHWLAERPTGSARYRVATSTEEIADDPHIEVVFVARAARDNAPTAIRMLQRGKSVLIEKPFALSLDEARQVVGAIAAGRVCGTGLVLLYAEPLQRFAAGLSRLGRLRDIDIDWCDAAGEIRRGAVKRFDPAVSIIADVLPHIWSILRLIDRNNAVAYRAIWPFDDALRVSAGGRHVALRLSVDGAHVNVELGREMASRRRVVQIVGEKGLARIDFSDEPGRAAVNQEPVDVAEGFVSPLRAELQAFVAAHLGAGTLGQSSCDRAIDAIALIDLVEPDYRAQQVEQICRAVEARSADADVRYAVRELTLAELLNVQRRTDLVARWNEADLVDAVIVWLGGGDIAAELEPALRGNAALAEIRRRCAR